MKHSLEKLASGLATCSLSLALCALVAGSARAQQSPSPQPASPAAQSPNASPNKVPAQVSETLVDSSIPDDAALNKMLEAYSPNVRALDVVIGRLKGDLTKGGMGAGSLGNFVTDGVRAQAGLILGKQIALVFVNKGGLRRDGITKGDLRGLDIFGLLPFENKLIAVDLTGEQLIKLLGVVVANREAQSGARIRYRVNAEKKKVELEEAKLNDARNTAQEIDPRATYTVVTIDYLYQVGGDDYKVLHEAKEMKPLGVTIRDAIIAYVKAETAAGREIKPNLDGRFIEDQTPPPVQPIRPINSSAPSINSSRGGLPPARSGSSPTLNREGAPPE